MSARDMARFGLLYLRNGRWREQQLIPEDWIAESTYPYSPDWNGVAQLLRLILRAKGG